MPAVKPMNKRKYGGSQPDAGPPITVVIDWDQVDEWLEEQRSQKWIAKKLKCHPDTLKDRVRTDRGAKDWSSYSEEKKRDGWDNLKHFQYASAKNGNTALLIWLGKVWLKQVDRSQVEQQVSSPSMNLNLKNLTIEELRTLNALLKKAETPKDDVKILSGG